MEIDYSDKAIIYSLQALSFLLLSLICFFFRRGRDKNLPFLLRPHSIIFMAILIGSIGSHTLHYDEYVEYAKLWIFQVIGVFLGFIAVDLLGVGNSNSVFYFNKERSFWFCNSIMVLAVISAFVFFLLQGVPALKGDLEQGRVDAAVSGTGYLRLMAYLSIPAALIRMAISKRGAYLWVAASLLITIGMANRSPLLYLFIPLGFCLWAYGNIKLNTSRIFISGLLLLVLVGGMGAYRVVTQDDFYSYDEYREDLVNNNYISIGVTALTHYSAVVPQNAVVAKKLIDDGAMNIKFGSSYLTLFISALPGEQLSLDREIKKLTGKEFIGGGTPPTIMGEGYINFWYFGVILNSILAVILLGFFSKRLSLSGRNESSETKPAHSVFYGFACCWVILSQVAGFAGASTFPISFLIIVFFFVKYCMRRCCVNR